MAAGCESPFVERVYSFYLTNNSTDEISFSYNLRYPDTLLYSDMRIISPSPQSKIPVDNKEEWEDTINKATGKKLQVFVFSVLVNDSNWQMVRENYLVKRRYTITADELKTMNYIIEYP